MQLVRPRHRNQLRFLWTIKSVWSNGLLGISVVSDRKSWEWQMLYHRSPNTGALNAGKRVSASLNYCMVTAYNRLLIIYLSMTWLALQCYRAFDSGDGLMLGLKSSKANTLQLMPCQFSTQLWLKYMARLVGRPWQWSRLWIVTLHNRVIYINQVSLQPV